MNSAAVEKEFEVADSVDDKIKGWEVGNENNVVVLNSTQGKENQRKLQLRLGLDHLFEDYD